MIQDYHMENTMLNYTDIGTHTRGYNYKSIGIAFIGDFMDEAPPKQQLIATHTIIAESVKQKKLIADYKLYGQRQLLATNSPGDALHDIIVKWKHWSAV